MSNVTLKVNGKTHTVDVDSATPLLYVLRNDIGVRGPRFGCGLGQCGSCTVIINGVATRSCITPVSSVKSEVTTLEGLPTPTSRFRRRACRAFQRALDPLARPRPFPIRPQR